MLKDCSDAYDLLRALDAPTVSSSMLISLVRPPINFWRCSKLWESGVSFALSKSALFYGKANARPH
jgi:hypothetical protein